MVKSIQINARVTDGDGQTATAEILSDDRQQVLHPLPTTVVANGVAAFTDNAVPDSIPADADLRVWVGTAEDFAEIKPSAGSGQALSITGFQPIVIESTRIRVEWQVGVVCSGFVRWGASAGSLTNTGVVQGIEGGYTFHRQWIDGLSPEQTIFVQAESEDASNNVGTSPIIEITTAAAATPPTTSGSWPSVANHRDPHGGTMIGTAMPRSSWIGNGRLDNYQAIVFTAMTSEPTTGFTIECRKLRQSDMENKYPACVSAGLTPAECQLTESSATYAKGNPTVRGELRNITGTGASTRPDMSGGALLGTTDIRSWSEADSGRPLRFTLGSSVALTPGQRYVWVLDNQDPMADPFDELTASQARTLLANNPTRGAFSLNGRFIGERAAVGPSNGPRLSPTLGDYGLMPLYSRDGVSWGFEDRMVPHLVTHHTDARDRGMTWYDESSFRSASRMAIDGSDTVRQTWTASGSATVDRLWLGFGHHDSVVPNGSSMTATIKRNGSQVATATFPWQSALATRNRTDNGDSFMKFLHDYVMATLSSSFSLSQGDAMEITLSASSGARFMILGSFPHPHLPRPIEGFDEGKVEKGSSGSYSRPGTYAQIDMPFALVPVGLPDRPQ